ncbi:unnamed protein product [Heligmosomoides polygyrus]|uniref:Tyrosine-protein phosphatase domain-containing protein n=1 Tax=Heligmosomoides polygyrus TaxID=6339 RepID=A0A183GL56_HELPZ|nr:unnamed protein product [Heligmosomoides polygyrus]
MKIVVAAKERLYHFFSAYASQTGCSDRAKDEFWNLLDEKIAELPPKDVIIVAGDLNGHDVGCLDATRVKLECCADDYIHANYVGTPNSSKRFICTQAPLEKTCKDFWMMCIQDRVEYIVMLCNIIEKGAKKCYQYFPANPGSLCFGDITIECIGSTMLDLGVSENTPGCLTRHTLKGLQGNCLNGTPERQERVL